MAGTLEKMAEKLNLEVAPLCGQGWLVGHRAGGGGRHWVGALVNNRWAQLGPPPACLTASQCKQD